MAAMSESVLLTGRSTSIGTINTLSQGLGDDRLVHCRNFPHRDATESSWPDWVHPCLLSALVGRGIRVPWSHQALAAQAAHEGRHVALSTGTASGKSLGYLLPMLSDVLTGADAPTGRGTTALYLSPTKALAADQLAHIEALALPGVRAATLDGDTPPDERRWVRDHAQIVLTNPDLLHHTLLPSHERWAPFWRHLRYVVVDECHIYRGVFGTHLALLLRRLRRIAARYGAAPSVIFASATIAEPAQHASRLLGAPVQAVSVDGSPRPELTFALWEPPLVDADGSEVAADAAAAGAPVAGRRSPLTEAALLTARLVDDDIQTVAFARSRKGVETMARMVRDRVQWAAPRQIAAYRGGYLPEERRELERRLRERDLIGLAATNALELGVDVTGLDAVVITGWPGSFASVWQQAGRAGRAGREAIALYVSDGEPLDTYLIHHPEALLDRPVESPVVDPTNRYVLAPHLVAAAAELPLTLADAELFGDDLPDLLDALVARGALRRRPTGWYWAHPGRPHDSISLRGTNEPVVRIVESGSGRVLGTVDWAAAHRQVHTGAVYVHQGVTHVVTRLDLEESAALVVPGDPGWTTTARSTASFDLVRAQRSVPRGPVTMSFGEVQVRDQVTSFLRRRTGGEVLGEHPLDLPEIALTTKGVWWTLDPDWLAGLGIDPATIPGATHAAEHAAIGLLPLVATVDRWDIGGVSTALHPDTGLPTILVYDGSPGGAGFAERGFDRAATWLSATAATIQGCPCRDGCPSCVHSPKCGNGNEPLAKGAALALLTGMSLLLR